jgi:hypothetical protein
MNNERKNPNKLAGMAFEEALTRLSKTDTQELRKNPASAIPDRAIAPFRR